MRDEPTTAAMVGSSIYIYMAPYLRHRYSPAAYVDIDPQSHQ